VPVSEIELELKQGQAASLFDVALALLQDVPLRLGHMSKAERGYRLAASQPLQAVKAQPCRWTRRCRWNRCFLPFAATARNRSAATRMAWRRARTWKACTRCVLRRLRSALGMFKTLLALPDALKTELDWLGARWARHATGMCWLAILSHIDGEAAADAAALAQAAREQARARTRAAQAVMSARHGMDAGHTALAAGAGRATAVRRASCGGWTGACRRSPMPPCARTSAA
jgi:inorganic triphosphatase YgiF